MALKTKTYKKKSKKLDSLVEIYVFFLTIRFNERKKCQPMMKLILTNLISILFPFFFFFFSFQVEGESQLSFVSSQKGKYQLSHEDYYYVREKVVNNKIYWRCIEYTSKMRCHARVHTIGNNIVRSTSHCHEPLKAKKKTFWISKSIEP